MGQQFGSGRIGFLKIQTSLRHIKRGIGVIMEIGINEVAGVLRGRIIGDRRPVLAAPVSDLVDEVSVTGCDMRGSPFGVGDDGGVDGEFQGVVVSWVWSYGFVVGGDGWVFQPSHSHGVSSPLADLNS